MALNELCPTAPTNLARVIVDKATVNKAWNAISTMCVGDKRIKENKAQQLRREFELATFNDGEIEEEFTLHLTGIQASLETLGEGRARGEVDHAQDPAERSGEVSTHGGRHPDCHQHVNTHSGGADRVVEGFGGFIRRGPRGAPPRRQAVHDGGGVGVAEEEERR